MFKQLFSALKSRLETPAESEALKTEPLESNRAGSLELTAARAAPVSGNLERDTPEPRPLSAPPDVEPPSDIIAIPFAPGQVWSYWHGPGGEGSRVVILKCETLNHQAVVHVSVVGMPDCPIGHLPVAERSLRESLTELESMDQVPDFSEAYQQWREAFDAGEGGVFAIPMAEIVKILTGVARPGDDF